MRRLEQSPLESVRLLKMAHETLTTLPEYADQIEMGEACKAGAAAIEKLRGMLCRACLINGFDCKCPPQ